MESVMTHFQEFLMINRFSQINILSMGLALCSSIDVSESASHFLQYVKDVTLTLQD